MSLLPPAPKEGITDTTITNIKPPDRSGLVFYTKRERRRRATKTFVISSYVVLFVLTAAFVAWSVTFIGIFASKKAPLSTQELKFGNVTIGQDNTISLNTETKGGTMNMGTSGGDLITSIVQADSNGLWTLLSSGISIDIKTVQQQETQANSTPGPAEYFLSIPDLTVGELRTPVLRLNRLSKGSLVCHDVEVTVDGSVNFKGNLVFQDYLQLVPKVQGQNVGDAASNVTSRGRLDIKTREEDVAGIILEGTDYSLGLTVGFDQDYVTLGHFRRSQTGLDGDSFESLVSIGFAVSTTAFLDGLQSYSVGGLSFTGSGCVSKSSQRELSINGDLTVRSDISVSNIHVGGNSSVSSSQVTDVFVSKGNLKVQGNATFGSVKLHKDGESLAQLIVPGSAPSVAGPSVEIDSLHSRSLETLQLTLEANSIRGETLSLETKQVTVQRLVASLSNVSDLSTPALKVTGTDVVSDDGDLLIGSRGNLLIKDELVVLPPSATSSVSLLFSESLKGLKFDLVTNGGMNLSSKDSLVILVSTLTLKGQLESLYMRYQSDGIDWTGEPIPLTILTPLELDSSNVTLQELCVGDISEGGLIYYAFEGAVMKAEQGKMIGDTVNFGVSLDVVPEPRKLVLATDKLGWDSESIYTRGSNNSLTFGSRPLFTGSELSVDNLSFGPNLILQRGDGGQLVLNTDIKCHELLCSSKLNKYFFSNSELKISGENSQSNGSESSQTFNSLFFYTGCLSLGDAIQFCPSDFPNCATDKEGKVDLSNCGSSSGRVTGIALNSTDIREIRARTAQIGSALLLESTNPMTVTLEIPPGFLVAGDLDINSATSISEGATFGDVVIQWNELRTETSDELIVQSSLSVSLSTVISELIIIDPNSTTSGILADQQSTIHLGGVDDRPIAFEEEVTYLEGNLIAGCVGFSPTADGMMTVENKCSGTDPVSIKADQLKVGDISISPNSISSGDNLRLLVPTTLQELQTNCLITTDLEGFLTVDNVSLELGEIIIDHSHLGLMGEIDVEEMSVVDEDGEVRLLFEGSAVSNTGNPTDLVIVDDISVETSCDINIAGLRRFDTTDPGVAIDFTDEISFESSVIVNSTAGLELSGSLDYFPIISDVSLNITDVTTSGLIVKNEAVFARLETDVIHLGNEGSQLDSKNILILKEVEDADNPPPDVFKLLSSSGVVDLSFRFEEGLSESSKRCLVSDIKSFSDTVVVESQVSAFVAPDMLLGNIMFAALDDTQGRDLASMINQPNVSFGNWLFLGADEVKLDLGKVTLDNDTDLSFGECLEEEQGDGLVILQPKEGRNDFHLIEGNTVTFCPNLADGNNITLKDGDSLSINGIDWKDLLIVRNPTGNIVIGEIGVRPQEPTVSRGMIVLSALKKSLTVHSDKFIMAARDRLWLEAISSPSFKASSIVVSDNVLGLPLVSIYESGVSGEGTVSLRGDTNILQCSKCLFSQVQLSYASTEQIDIIDKGTLAFKSETDVVSLVLNNNQVEKIVNFNSKLEVSDEAEFSVSKTSNLFSLHIRPLKSPSVTSQGKIALALPHIVIGGSPKLVLGKAELDGDTLSGPVFRLFGTLSLGGLVTLDEKGFVPLPTNTSDLKLKGHSIFVTNKENKMESLFEEIKFDLLASERLLGLKIASSGINSTNLNFGSPVTSKSLIMVSAACYESLCLSEKGIESNKSVLVKPALSSTSKMEIKTNSFVDDDGSVSFSSAQAAPNLISDVKLVDPLSFDILGLSFEGSTIETDAQLDLKFELIVERLILNDLAISVTYPDTVLQKLCTGGVCISDNDVGADAKVSKLVSNNIKLAKSDGKTLSVKGAAGVVMSSNIGVKIASLLVKTNTGVSLGQLVFNGGNVTTKLLELGDVVVDGRVTLGTIALGKVTVLSSTRLFLPNKLGASSELCLSKMEWKYADGSAALSSSDKVGIQGFLFGESLELTDMNIYGTLALNGFTFRVSKLYVANVKNSISIDEKLLSRKLAGFNINGIENLSTNKLNNIFIEENEASSSITLAAVVLGDMLTIDGKSLSIGGDTVLSPTELSVSTIDVSNLTLSSSSTGSESATLTVGSIVAPDGISVEGDMFTLNSPEGLLLEGTRFGINGIEIENNTVTLAENYNCISFNSLSFTRRMAVGTSSLDILVGGKSALPLVVSAALETGNDISFEAADLTVKTIRYQKIVLGKTLEVTDGLNSTDNDNIGLQAKVVLPGPMLDKWVFLVSKAVELTLDLNGLVEMKGTNNSNPDLFIAESFTLDNVTTKQLAYHKDNVASSFMSVSDEEGKNYIDIFGGYNIIDAAANNLSGDVSLNNITFNPGITLNVTLGVDASFGLSSDENFDLTAKHKQTSGNSILSLSSPTVQLDSGQSWLAGDLMVSKDVENATSVKEVTTPSLEANSFVFGVWNEARAEISYREKKLTLEVGNGYIVDAVKADTLVIGKDGEKVKIKTEDKVVEAENHTLQVEDNTRHEITLTTPVVTFGKLVGTNGVIVDCQVTQEGFPFDSICASGFHKSDVTFIKVFCDSGGKKSEFGFMVDSLHSLSEGLYSDNAECGFEVAPDGGCRMLRPKGGDKICLIHMGVQADLLWKLVGEETEEPLLHESTNN